MMSAHFNVMALGHFTNGTWFEKQGKEHIPYLPAKFDAALKEIADEGERHVRAEEIFRPFSIGAARVDISDSKFKNNAPIPKKIAERLETAFQQIDIPGISFNGKIGGQKIWAGLVFEIHPLIIDCDRRKAYHPVTVGLAFEHKIVRGNLVSFTPAKWPKKDREALWKELLKSLLTLA